MCGFAGFLRLGQGVVAEEAERVVRAMARRLRNRGPDDAGVFVGPQAGFAVGFRRLAVIDLSPTGHQPMISADGRHVLVYNGEIYNAAELRHELEAAGVRLRGRSDTEVLLEQLSRSGVAATLPRLVGMFALAFFDLERRELVLARDRLGIKPLVWGRSGDQLLFASEAGALHAHPAFVPEIDREALALYLRFGYVPAPRSIWRGLGKLPPGHYVRIDRDGQEETVCWWDLGAVCEATVDPMRFRDEEEALDAFEELLADAVARHMVADVPLGVFLSGGPDSALIAALAARRAGAPLRTFTVGFDDPAFDESAHARAVARIVGADHTERTCRIADALAIVPRLAGMFDEPFADSSAIPTSLLCRQTREEVTVALSGDGGDELFAGYTRYTDTMRIHRGLTRLPAALRSRMGAALGAFAESTIAELGLGIPGIARLKPDERAAKLAEIAGAVPERIMRALISHHARPERLVPGLREPLEEPWVGGLAPRLRMLPERLQLADMATYLPDDILTKVDRASMAVGLEVRVPLLDHRVVEFVWRLPPEMRVRNGRAKHLLRRLLARHLPVQLFDRPKHGFSVPLHDWLRGPLAGWARELVTPERLHAAGPFDARFVRRLFDEHRTGRVDRRFELWNLLSWLAWHRHWIEREQVTSAEAVVAA